MEEENANVLDSYLTDFCRSCDDGLNAINRAIQLTASEPEKFTEELRDMVVGYVILNIFSLWEKFIEDIFIAYMLGKASSMGNPCERYVFPVDEVHAYQMIKGINQYPEWSNVDTIQVYANNFLKDGKPFSKLLEMQDALKSLKKIRNALAHSSKDAKRKFENLVQGKLGRLPDGITPVRFLIEHRTGRTRNSSYYYEYYIDFLKETAGYLVENPSET